MALSKSDTESHSFFEANMPATFTDRQVFQFLDGFLAARPQLLPVIRTYLEDRDVPPVAMNQNKRKRETMENTGHLRELFESLTPSLSYAADERPSKVLRYPDDSAHKLLHLTGHSLENNQGLAVKDTPITPRSAIQCLEKRMERCFGVAPDTSTYPTARPLKRKRSFLDDDLNDYAILTMVEQTSENGQAQMSGSTAEEGPPEKRVQTAFGNVFNAGSTQALNVPSTLPHTSHTQHTVPETASQGAIRPDPVNSASTFAWILWGSKVDLAQICPFSLYPNSKCVWSSDCKLKRVCKNNPCKFPDCTHEHLRITCGYVVRGEYCPNATLCQYGHDRKEQRQASYARRHHHALTGE